MLTDVLTYSLLTYVLRSRLIILLGPVASALGGVCIGFCIDQFILHPVGRILKVTLIGDAPREGPAIDEAASADDKDPKASINLRLNELTLNEPLIDTQLTLN